MTLFRQILMLISFLVFIMFSINYVSSINHIREYEEIESRIHAWDTAKSLALSLKPHMAKVEDALNNTPVKSIFDRGYYKEIIVFNSNGNTLGKLLNINQVEGIPVWFIELQSLEPASAESKISSGQMILGTVRVTVNPGRAYYKLFQKAKSLAFSSLWMFGVSVVFLFIILKWILRPLSEMEQLAIDISEGHFETIEKLPSTTEIRDLATRIDMMSGKVDAHAAQLKKNAQDLTDVLKSERAKRLEFEAANKQIKKCSEGLKSTLVSLREAKPQQHR